jgi:hypothetical protein
MAKVPHHMIRIPPFHDGTHYRQLSPAEGVNRWRWELTKELHIRLPYRVPDASFADAQGREWMQHDMGWRIIRKGYRWNGCSPKRHIPLLGWIGTPDTARNLLASCVHDAAYQFSGTDHWPTTREQEDHLFFDILRASGFRMARAWHGAVRDFGGPAWARNIDNLTSKLL